MSSPCCAMLAFSLAFQPGGLAVLRSQQESPQVTAAQTPTLEVQARAVLLDVVVTDRQGNLVNDLTRDEFHVTEDRVSQTVRTFEPPSEHRMPGGQLTMLGDSGMRNYEEAPLAIFVLDELNTKFEDMAHARLGLRSFLEQEPATLPQPALLVAVTNTGMIKLVDWTQERDRVVRALDQRRPNVPFRLYTGADVTASAQRFSDSLAALAQIAQSTAGEHGRKNVIWLGHGFPSLNMTNLDPDSQQVIGDALHSTATILLASRLAVYTVDPAGLPAYAAAAASSENPDGSAPTDLIDPREAVFEGITAQTGGRAFRLRNDLDAAIAESVHQGGSYYALSYSPTNRIYDGKFRVIRVTVDRPGMVIYTRAGYYADPDHHDSPQMVAFELTKASTSALAYTGLNVSVSNLMLGERPHDAGFHLSVDPGGLTWRTLINGDRQAVFDIAITAAKNDGKILAYKVKALATTAKAGKANEVMSAALRYTVPVELPAGTEHLRIVVRDATSGRIGTAEFQGTQLRLLAKATAQKGLK